MAFQLLGYILEKHAGEPFDTIIQKQILNPLGMNETTVFAPENSLNGVVPVSKEASGWSTRRSGTEALVLNPSSAINKTNHPTTDRRPCSVV